MGTFDLVELKVILEWLDDLTIFPKHTLYTILKTLPLLQFDCFSVKLFIYVVFFCDCPRKIDFFEFEI